MKKLLYLSSALLLTSCMGIPDDLMKPSTNTLQIRKAQSRSFNVQSDKQLLRASVSVLQDMGYAVKESSSEYGVLTASKEASAVSAGQVAGAIILTVLGSKPVPYDKTQHITITMVILDKSQDDKATARTTFQRVIVRTDNSHYAETITDQGVYGEFYEKLDKALFLEVNNI